MTLGPGITRTLLPKGFSASGINSGVRRYRPDLGVILSDRDAVAAGVYTKNECQAACVLYSKALTPSSRIRAIVTNSGQANAATGPAGVETNLRMASAVAEQAGCAPNQVLTASTGVIGVALEIDKIVRSVPELIQRASDVAEPFALAILTTDLIPKTVSHTVELSQGSVCITGIAKGSGMIHPNMATMLGYLLTDAEIPAPLAQEFLSEATDRTFNMISVDGDTSTNDCVFLLANGASQVGLVTNEDREIFRKALTEVAEALAKAIARDGEGSTKLIEVEITGAPSLELARKAARGITVSPLIKSAIHGEDPNWGRVLARLGAEGVPASSLAKMDLSIQGVSVMKDGSPVAFDREEARRALKRETVSLVIELKSGEASAKAWGCDLSAKYVAINAEYS
jgi:glutamate N-acetyltransferase / amino-acid N-acetyltransferase